MLIFLSHRSQLTSLLRTALQSWDQLGPFPPPRLAASSTAPQRRDRSRTSASLFGAGERGPSDDGGATGPRPSLEKPWCASGRKQPTRGLRKRDSLTQHLQTRPRQAQKRTFHFVGYSRDCMLQKKHMSHKHAIYHMRKT